MSRNYQEISVHSLVPFKDHPFKLYAPEEQRFTDMVESVHANGVLTPIIVRPLSEGKYEILSGHNRVEAAREAGLETVPAIVREGLSDDEAMFIVTETNLIQRSFADLKHSERAVVIAVHYESMKKKSGYRSDLLDEVESTSDQLGPRSWASGKIGEHYGLSSTTIKRYLRVDKLIQDLKDLLDADKIGIVVAVSLSYLREHEQEIIVGLLSNGVGLTMKRAEALRKESAERELSEDDIVQILKKPAKTKPHKISIELMERYFTDTDESEIESVIAEALAAYFGK